MPVPPQAPVAGPGVLDAELLRRWCEAGTQALRDVREEVDALNVYPVPDGDTGTNLLLTLEAVQEALAAAPPDLPSTARAVVRGALLGARGNSGVIVSQLLRGVAEAVAEECGSAADVLREGLRRGDALARAAVAAPVEGTVLTVARAAAEGCRGERLEDAVRTAAAAAAAALARTPEQLEALRLAGVVDAGGRGWCVLLEALERVVTGVLAAPAPAPAPLVPRGRSGVAVREAGSEEFAYEVQFLLSDADEAAVQRLGEQLAALGDSLVVVGGEGLFNVHVHVNDVGAALEAAVAAGRPSRISVTRFADQVAGTAAGPVMNERPALRAVVAVAPGAGLAALLAEAGARVVDGGPGAAPSTAQVLEAVRATGAREVLVLPDDANVLAVASQAAAAAEGVVVRVVPTRAVVQGLAALAVADLEDAALPLEELAERMQEAADAVCWAEVTTAVRDARTAAGPCRAGDALGLLRGEVVEVGERLEDVARALLDRLLADGPELVTLLPGADAPTGLAAALAEVVEAAGAEVVVHEGGQPHYPLLLGAE